MTETSYFWDGLVTGDAVLSPYSSDVWHSLWQTMFSRAANEGVLNNIDNELAVTGVAGGVSVATGKALVDGTLYQNDAAVSVTIASPVTDPRIDRIVIRKDWSTKTIRIALVAGTENAAPTAPALAQTAGDKWEIPLAQALITTAGVITVTNERENARTRLALAGAGVSEIETIASTGIESAFDFVNIPSTFKHLEMHGNLLLSPGGAGVVISFNGDTSVANYNREAFGRSAGAVAAAPAQGTALPVISVQGSGALSDEYNTQAFMRMSNYQGTTFFKTGLQKETSSPNNTVADLGITVEEFLWMDTNAINRITVTANAGVLKLGSNLTLYGIS